MPRKSKGEYPDDWKVIARECKDAAGWKCVRCSSSHDPAAGYALTVHHLDLDPRNNAWWNLAALCQRCHLRIQAKVVMERVWLYDHSDWFVPYVAGYYAAKLGLSLNRDEVIARAAELIEIGQGRRAFVRMANDAVDPPTDLLAVRLA
jgi:hypothetical protein